MAHAPGVGYSAQRPAAPAPAAPAPSSAPPAGVAPAAAASPTWSLPSPDLSSISIPGGSTGEKALVVAGILLLGLFFYSRVTGKPIALGLAGPSAGSPAPLNPNTVGGAALSAGVLSRTALANPGKVA